MFVLIGSLKVRVNWVPAGMLLLPSMLPLEVADRRTGDAVSVVVVVPGSGSTSCNPVAWSARLVLAMIWRN